MGGQVGNDVVSKEEKGRGFYPFMEIMIFGENIDKIFKLVPSWLKKLWPQGKKVTNLAISFLINSVQELGVIL